MPTFVVSTLTATVVSTVLDSPAARSNMDPTVPSTESLTSIPTMLQSPVFSTRYL